MDKIKNLTALQFIVLIMSMLILCGVLLVVYRYIVAKQDEQITSSDLQSLCLQVKRLATDVKTINPIYCDYDRD